MRLALASLLLHVALDCLAQEPGLVPDDPGVQGAVKVETGYMVPYEATIPNTTITFEMIPISGGEFTIGSPPDEPNRQEDEGPQVRVKVAPFWMGKCEVTWAEYQAFMEQYNAFKKLEELHFTSTRMETAKKQLAKLHAVKEYFDKQSLEVDAVTCPTPLYDSSFTYGPGEDSDQPAITMTQFAAKQYTKWLSGITGQQYRLPTEAEWEYAARAGTVSAFSFGDDVDQIGKYAWTADNADYETHKVASLEPNPWGLFDMHGNAGEWVLDQYHPDHYATLKDGILASAAVAWPTKLFPRVIRGGSWLSEASDCRSAARLASDDLEWTIQDPNLPTSPWWFTEEAGTGIGFRILRPLEKMDAELCKKVWDADIERIREDVADRLEEGRGARSAADRNLPAAISELKASTEE